MSSYDVEAPGVVRGFLLPIQDLASTRKLAPIFFQTMPNTSDTKSAQYGGETPMGRTEPIPVYQSSGARNISLTLTYAAISAKFDQSWVAQQVSRLQALVYPIFSRRKSQDAAFSPPPLVLLNLGFRYVNVPCVVTQYQINQGPDEAYQVYTMLPVITVVTIQLQTAYPYGAAPGHDDIAAKFVGNPSFETAGSGDAVLPTEVSPSYDALAGDVPISVRSDQASIASYQRTLEVSGYESRVLSRSLAEVAFRPEDMQG